MPRLRVSDIVEWINRLGTTRAYNYYSGNTRIRLTEVNLPEGPIRFLRWGVGGSEDIAREGGISENQLATVASVFSRKPNYPIHFDRLFSGGGNSRSALETLLALTPQFFICYPQKTNLYNGNIDNRLKHIMWCPDDAHTLGELHTKDYTQVISEVEYELDFGNIQIDQSNLTDEFDSIEAKRTHTQMQVALIKIGNALDFRTWVASNDRSIRVENTTLGNLEGVVPSLNEIEILYTAQSKTLSSLIDCIWFSNDYRYMPAVIEIEHSTGVRSGLARMLQLREALPSVQTNCTVVAANEMRNKVMTDANLPAFRRLNTRYMSYTTVRELYGLIQRYNLSNYIERTFIEPFMEPMVGQEL